MLKGYLPPERCKSFYFYTMPGSQGQKTSATTLNTKGFNHRHLGTTSDLITRLIYQEILDLDLLKPSLAVPKWSAIYTTLFGKKRLELTVFERCDLVTRVLTHHLA